MSDIGLGVHAIGCAIDRKGLTENRATLMAQESQESMRQLAGARLLLVENNELNQEVASELLTGAGLLVEIANNGQEALEQLQQGSFDLVLMDMQMPVMDGLTATRRIREEEAVAGRPRTPIIALTANAMAHQEAEYRAAGMDALVPKPLEVARLVEAIAAVTGE